MRELTNLPRNILKLLTVLLLVVLSIFLIQFAFGKPIKASSPMIAPTSTPEFDFVLEIPQKALWKNYVHVSAEAAPGTVCTLRYIPPSGNMQEMSSTADENGM
jgi:hypothetical protein